MTMFMIMGPADKFDRKGMDAFLGSIAPLGGAIAFFAYRFNREKIGVSERQIVETQK